MATTRSKKVLGQGVTVVTLLTIVGCGGRVSVVDTAGYPSVDASVASPTDSGAAPVAYDTSGANAIDEVAAAPDVDSTATFSDVNAAFDAVDAAFDSSLSDSDAGSDGSTADATAVDAADTHECANYPDYAPCVAGSNGARGYCSFGACSLCSSLVKASGDIMCANTYGIGHICNHSSCEPGPCQRSLECLPSKSLCLFQACVACVTNEQCQSDPTYGLGATCDVSTGVCAAPSCPGFVCRNCNAVQGAVFYVDPLRGSDDPVITGADNCPFRSVTHAMAAAGNLTGATIRIVDNVIRLVLDERSGEVFPIRVPRGVTIEPQYPAPGTVLTYRVVPADPPTFLVSTGNVGFILSSPGSRLSQIRVDGKAGGDTGIAVYGGSDPTTMLDRVSVYRMRSSGVVVGNADREITSGQATVTGDFSGNGTADSMGAGLRVYGHGVVHVTSDGIFAGSNPNGILVTDAGSLTVDATQNRAGGGDLLGFRDNKVGLWIAQDPTQVTSSDVNLIYGMYDYGSLSHDSIHVTASSHLRMRHSVIWNVRIASAVGATGLDDLSTIDLGTAAGPDYGYNTFDANTAAICLQVKPNSGRLLAAGNVFYPVDCSTTRGTIRRSANCADPVDVGGIAPGDTTTVDVSNCN
jgi:hypothetical protein